jgi:hypothetical protein
MKTKFELNVAQELPKTRMSQEPGLPWKLNPEDIEKMSGKDEYKAAVTNAPPLKTRAVFIVLLLATIFITAMYFVSLVVFDNANTHNAAQKESVTMSSIQTALSKINGEKNTLSENIGQLEKRVSELNAQKELFATVIESLTRKTDEPAIQSDSEKVSQQDKVSAQNTDQALSATPKSTIL